MKLIIFVLGCLAGAASCWVYLDFTLEKREKGTAGENYFLKQTYLYERYFRSMLKDSFEDDRFSIQDFGALLSDELELSICMTTAGSVLLWGDFSEHPYPSDFGMLIPRGTSNNQSFDFIFIFYTKRNNLYEIISMNIGGENGSSFRYYRPSNELLFDAPKIRGKVLKTE